MEKERKMIWRSVPNPDSRFSVLDNWFDFEGDLDDLIISMQRQRVKYKDCPMRVDKKYGHYGEGDYLVIEYGKLESNDEYKTRIECEEKEEKESLERARQQYEKLKKKFEVDK